MYNTIYLHMLFQDSDPSELGKKEKTPSETEESESKELVSDCLLTGILLLFIFNFVVRD